MHDHKQKGRTDFHKEQDRQQETDWLTHQSTCSEGDTCDYLSTE
jgi:hypothetical protein